MAKNEKNCSIQITIFWSITFANNTHGLLNNKLIVTALPRTSYPAICGTSSGHHMYIHLGRTSTTTASLKVGPTCAYVDIYLIVYVLYSMAVITVLQFLHWCFRKAFTMWV